MNKVQPDGSTIREHLEAVERQTGIRPAKLDGPPIPTGAEYLWNWFITLNTTRGNTGFGPAQFTFAEMAAWAALTGNRPEPWEVMILKALDAAWMVNYSKKA